MSTAIRVASRDGVPVGAGADRRERDRRGAELVGDFEATPVAAREEPRFAGVAAAPDRADGVDHESGGEPEPGRGLGVAERAAIEVAAGVEQLRAGRPVDRPVDAAPAEQRRVGGVDDRVDVLGGDVAERDLELGDPRVAA